MIGFVLCGIIIIGLFILGSFLLQWMWDKWYYAGGFVIVWYVVYNVTNYLLEQDLGWLIQIILKAMGIPI